MATAAQNYQMLEETLARNLSNPINNYVAANTALGIQRAQQTEAQARRLAEIQAERNFQVQQQARNLDSQVLLQGLAAENQRAAQNFAATAARESRTYDTLLRQADIARTDPLMGDFNPTATPEETVQEYNRRRSPEFSNPFYAERAREGQLRVQSALSQLGAGLAGASEDAKRRAIQSTLIDPAVSATLIENDISGEDINAVLRSGNEADFQKLISTAAKNAGGWFGRKKPSSQLLTDVQGTYFKYLGDASEASKNNPRFLTALNELQDATKVTSAYLGQIKDRKLLSDLLVPVKPASSTAVAPLGKVPAPTVTTPAASVAAPVQATNFQGVVPAATGLLSKVPAAATVALTDPDWAPYNPLMYLRQGLNYASGGMARVNQVDAQQAQARAQALAVLGLQPDPVPADPLLQDWQARQAGNPILPAPVQTVAPAATGNPFVPQPQPYYVPGNPIGGFQ